MNLKVSKYNMNMLLDNKNAIYNMVSSKYVLYDSLEKDYVDKLLNNLNKDTYEIREAEIIKKLFKNGIVVDDELDEVKKVSYIINKSKYQDRNFYLTISPTLDCNFRCPYCCEERREVSMNDETIENVIEYVKVIAKKVKRLNVSWFGGEPMLEYETIKRFTKNFQEICKTEGCDCKAKMTSNGYLFSDERIDELKDLGIESIQITVDGDEEHHDKSRPLENGEGTFKKVLDSVIKIAAKNIQVIFRINIDENNINSIPKLLDMIPQENRKNIQVSIVNIFQNEKKISEFNLLKAAIDKGFRKGKTSSISFACEAVLTNSLSIQPDGRISACQNAAEKGFYFGRIEKHGKLNITNNSELLKFRYTSPVESKRCITCKLLPLCTGSCPLALYKHKDECVTKKRFGGMNFEDIAKLHIYYDSKYNHVQEVNVL